MRNVKLNRAARISFIVAGAILPVASATQKAEAAVVIIVREIGADVIVNGSGAIDLSGIEPPRRSSDRFPYVEPDNARLVIGSEGSEKVWREVTGPTSLGAGGPADQASRNLVGVLFGGAIVVPTDYVSNSPLSGAAIFHDMTFASLGLASGRYVCAWGSGANTDSPTIEVSVPETPTWAMLLLGFAAFTTMRPHPATA